MRIGHEGDATSVLGYCTNVHPIEDPDDALGALDRFCGPVREALGADRLVLGLWLSRRASEHFDGSPDDLDRLREGLAANALEVATLNGFPYGDFHASRVKEGVYRPDWTDPARVDYTLALARILAALLPGDLAEGTISTLPLGDRMGASPDTVARHADGFVRCAAGLDAIAQETGRPIRLCIEPEPECLVETTDEAIRFFHDDLRAAARRAGVGDEVLDRHLGLCFDACHQATQFEDVGISWQAITEAGIRIGKVQLSCALEVSDATAAEAREALAPFDEPRFLHQVRRRRGDGTIDRWRDLDEAFRATDGEDGRADWRVHFHSPLHAAPEGNRLGITVRPLRSLLPWIASAEPIPHLEVETYTWNVLPESMRPTDDASLIDGIAREIRWAEDSLAACGVQRIDDLGR